MADTATITPPTGGSSTAPPKSKRQAGNMAFVTAAESAAAKVSVSVTKLSPKPGDLFILTYDPSSQRSVEASAQMIAELFPQCKFLVAPNGTELRHLDADLLAHFGLMKVE